MLTGLLFLIYAHYTIFQIKKKKKMKGLGINYTTWYKLYKLNEQGHFSK